MHPAQEDPILGKNLAERLDNSVGGAYVLCVGAANMDIAGSTSNRLTPGDSIPGRIRSAPGGVARNVAENLARLGNDARLSSAVGDDLVGRSLLESTGSAGVDVRACWVLAGEATAAYVSLHGPDGDMAAAVNDMSILERITPELLATHIDLLHGATALFIDCNLSVLALEWLFSQAGQAPIFVDPVSAFKCLRVNPWLGRIHTLKANRLEAQALCGHAIESGADVEGAARWLHTQGVQQVVLSLGERGVYWSGKAGLGGWQRALPVAVVNATGAGDALMAGLLHATLQGAALAQAVCFANGCAALTMMAPQANHPGLGVAAVQELLADAARSS